MTAERPQGEDLARRLYGDRDPRDVPRYSIASASRYLRISPATLRSWVIGRPYPRSGGTGYFEPLLRRPDSEDRRLSFSNLVEAHVLRALRTRHQVAMSAVRTALDYAEREYQIDRLLLSDELRAAPGNLFLDRYGELVNLGRAGQLAVRQLLEAHLKRIERDITGLPARLYPVTRESGLGLEAPKVIVIDPRISFGRPIVATRAIRTSTIVDRIDAGESVAEIAADYDLETAEIAEAVLYERAA